MRMSRAEFIEAFKAWDNGSVPMTVEDKLYAAYDLGVDHGQHHDNRPLGPKPNFNPPPQKAYRYDWERR